jgi:hypothetical protein
MWIRGLAYSAKDENMPLRITRKCVRYQVDWEVKTCNGQPVAETFLSDISAIGAKLEGPRPLASRNHLEFTYLKPGDGRERSHAGVVMWMRPLIHKPGRFHMGVKFFETDWSLDQELRQGAQF